MSLGIIFKGPEGVVLAADSRVTLTAQQPNQNLIIPATFDNATKLLKINRQDFVGVVTYGQGAIGMQAPRTAHSFLPEFEDELNKKKKRKRLEVTEFSKELSDFFLNQWQVQMPKDYKGPDMDFLIGGYDVNGTYGRVFEVTIPNHPTPKEWYSDSGNFGLVWGGQKELTERLLKGFDPNLIEIIKKELNLTDTQVAPIRTKLDKQLGIGIPYQFLPLQDCVDLAIFLIHTTKTIQSWQLGIRGVGGAIDVATITRTGGFKIVQHKKITGESF